MLRKFEINGEYFVTIRGADAAIQAYNRKHHTRFTASELSVVICGSPTKLSDAATKEVKESTKCTLCNRPGLLSGGVCDWCTSEQPQDRLPQWGDGPPSDFNDVDDEPCPYENEHWKIA